MRPGRAPLGTVDGFRPYAAARTISWSGSAVSTVALPVTVYQLTGSSLWTSAVAMAAALPYLVLGLVAGWVADRSRLLTVMVRADLVSALALATVPAAYLLDVLSAVHLLVAAAVAQSGFVFFDAANFGFLPALVGRGRILAANSLLFSLGSVVDSAVPAVAGLLMATVAAPLLVAADAASFLFSALLLTRVRTRVRTRVGGAAAARRGGAAFGAEVREGLRYLLTTPVVRVSTAISALLTVANGAMLALLIVWANQSFHIVRGDARLGVLYSTAAVAGVAAGAVAAPASRYLGSYRALRGLVPAAAVSGYAMLAVGTWWAAALLLLATATCVTAAVIVAVSIRQAVVPDELQSRVNTTARMIAYGGGFAAGAGAAGALANSIGAVGALRCVFLVLPAAYALSWSLGPDPSR